MVPQSALQGRDDDMVEPKYEDLARGTRVSATLSVAGLVALTYLGGIVAAQLGFFPSGQLRAAAEAVRDWRENWRHYFQIRSKFAANAQRTPGVAVRDGAAVSPGHTFIVGYRDSNFHPFLLTPDGKVAHEWTLSFNEIWPDPRHVAQAPPDWDISLHGASLLEDGSVVVNFEGLGTIKLGRCSRVLWQVATQSHHALDVLPNGEVLIASRRMLAERRPELPGVRVGPDGWMWDDTIVRVDIDGKVLSETSVLERLLTGGLASVVYANSLDAATLGHTDDPLHLNDVEMLRPEMADAFPLFAAGDVMISARNINTIAVLNGDTLDVKWSMTGPFLRQHDPDFLPNGHILLFDNRKGGPTQEFGASRILEIDPVTRQVVWGFTGSPEEPFYTDARGKQQSQPNGNILVTEAQKGRVFELARLGRGGRIVAEWVNGLAEDGLAGFVTQADRIPPDRLGFLDQPCGVPAASAAGAATPPAPG